MHAGGNRRRDAAVRRGARPGLDRRARTRARTRAQLRRRHRRRRDRQEGAASVDTIAEFIVERTRQTPRLRVRLDARNAFTVDLEEWFHVCGAGDALAPRPLGSPAVPRRVDDAHPARPARALRTSARRFSSSAGWPSVIRALLKPSVAPDTKSDRTATFTSRRLSSAPSGSTPTFAKASPPYRAVTGGGVTMFRAPEWSINGAFAWALDMLAEEGFRLDASMAPLQDRRGRPLAAPSSCQRHRRRPDNGSTSAGGGPFRAGDADGVGLGAADELSATCPSYDRRRERCQAASGPDGAPVGARSEPAARAFAGEIALCALFPTGWIQGPSSRHPARSRLWPAWRRLTYIPRILKISVRIFAACALACLLAGKPLFAAEATPALRLAVLDEPDGSALRLLDEVGRLPFSIAIGLSGSPADASLDTRLTALAKRGVPVWLVLRAPDTEQDMAAWQAALHRLLERHGAALAILEVSVDRQPSPLAGFAVQIAATEARANRESIRIAIGGSAMAERARREDLYRRELAPYVDLLDLPNPGRMPSSTGSSRSIPAPPS